ncbi:uncharacterized protein DMENIID0001_034790 [Sergentomyia squamirostris]
MAETVPESQIKSGTGKVQINARYFVSLRGILKLIQLILGIICMALIIPVIANATYFFLVAVIISLVITVVWCFIYLLEVKELHSSTVKWTLTELVTTCFAAIMYFVAFIVHFDAWGPVVNYFGFSFPYASRNITAGVFGILNFLAYLAGTFYLVVDYRFRSK